MAKNRQSVTEVKIKVLSEEDLEEPLLPRDYWSQEETPSFLSSEPTQAENPVSGTRTQAMQSGDYDKSLSSRALAKAYASQGERYQKEMNDLRNIIRDHKEERVKVAARERLSVLQGLFNDLPGDGHRSDKLLRDKINSHFEGRTSENQAMFQFAKENKLHGDTVESIQRKREEYQKQVQQDEDEKNKTGEYVTLPTPELKEVLMDYGYSGVKAGDMMEVIRKRYVDGSIYDQTGTNDLYYEGYLNESKDLTYLPQYIFSKEHAEPEKYSRRRTPTKWTKNKLRQGKHSAKEKLKKGTRWAKRQMRIQGGGQRKRRRRSKLTRGKHKTRKHKTRKKTRKRIKSRRP
jgi:hypothetical protein